MPIQHAPKGPRSPSKKTPGIRTLALVAVLMLGGCAQLPKPETEEEKVRAELRQREQEAARPTNLCRPDPGTPFSLRKKVLVLAMPVDKPLQAADLPGITTLWPNALSQRLEQTDRFLFRDGTAHSLDPLGNIAQQVTTLARHFDAQFVIAGRLNTLAIQRRENQSGLTKYVPIVSRDKRMIESSLELYDGFNGTLIARRHLGVNVTGDTEYRGQGPLRGEFFDTPLGVEVDKLLTEQSRALEDEMACLPMQARVTRIQGAIAVIDAGFTSNLKPGDSLRLYLRPPTSVAQHASRSGNTEKLHGTLVIDEVFPESARGHLDGGFPTEWKHEAVVRAW